MKRSKQNKRNLHVIFAGPEQQERTGTKYYAKDGSVTDIKSKAARFSSVDDAQEFADLKGIKLSETHYIGIETFTEHDLAAD